MTMNSNSADPEPLVIHPTTAFHLSLNEKLNLLPTASVPLYEGKSANYTPEGTGTGFVVQVGPYKKLITARHVTDRLTDKRFYVPHNGQLRPFNCHIHRFGQADTDPSQDPLDISVIDLDEQQADQLRQFHFFGLEDFEHQHGLSANCHYAFVGYPSSKNDGNFKTTELSAHLFRYCGVSTTIANHTLLNRQPETHVCIDFSKKSIDTDGKRFTAPNPYGISGGPVWALGTAPQIINASNTATPLIAGMGIEFRKNTLIAVRGCLILQVIRDLHSDLMDVIKPCPYVRLQHTHTKPTRRIILNRH